MMIQYNVSLIEGIHPNDIVKGILPYQLSY
jgi:hypothetical protein